MFHIILNVLICLPIICGADYTNRINPHKNWGEWEGWGTSLAWWANVLGDRDDVADLMFTTKLIQYNNQSVPGLGLNIIRYNVGGCSANSIGADHMIASPKIPKFKQIEGFWLNWDSDDPQSKSWDWSVDKKQRLMVQKAQDRGVDQIELFSNSPMWWMLYDHNPSGAPNGGENLQTWNYQKFAVYLATVAKYAVDHWNVTFRSVEAFNEASSMSWTSEGNQEGCHIGSEAQQKVIMYLRDELNKRGLNETLVSASDEVTVDSAIKMWESFPQSVRATVGRVNVHGYGYFYGKRDKLYDLVRKDNKPIWTSEYGEGDGTGLPMAQNLNLDLFWMHTTAWVYWQTFDSSQGWGMIHADLEKGSTGVVAAKYYVMAQYSRHIRKGMLIVESDRSDSVAAYDQSNRRLVIVTLNIGDDSQNITYDLSQFGRITDGSVSRWTTTPDDKQHYVFDNKLNVKAKTLNAVLNKKSIHTIVIENVFIQ
ncbi:unnamed protein product [Medioppia subpectinata]|uniref:Endo-beta-1,6-galactanase-like domain-containing protein n=1 Tax=Medioppia subpectinata TaxID=1979941 RepID=A0A7R9L1Z6_9ACAR|nr:unnamed protein product [Medioppia subpectinata]CAG2113834.1 unnamed protein product [Medioppia subpectinata]